MYLLKNLIRNLENDLSDKGVSESIVLRKTIDSDTPLSLKSFSKFLIKFFSRYIYLLKYCLIK